MPYELTNKKTKIAYFVSDEEFESIKAAGRLKQFTIASVEPIRKLIPIPKLINPEVEIKTKSKNK